MTTFLALLLACGSSSNRADALPDDFDEAAVIADLEELADDLADGTAPDWVSRAAVNIVARVGPEHMATLETTDWSRPADELAEEPAVDALFVATGEVLVELGLLQAAPTSAKDAGVYFAWFITARRRRRRHLPRGRHRRRHPHRRGRPGGRGRRRSRGHQKR